MDTNSILQLLSGSGAVPAPQRQEPGRVPFLSSQDLPFWLVHSKRRKSSRHWHCSPLRWISCSQDLAHSSHVVVDVAISRNGSANSIRRAKPSLSVATTPQHVFPEQSCSQLFCPRLYTKSRTCEDTIIARLAKTAWTKPAARAREKQKCTTLAGRDGEKRIPRPPVSSLDSG